MAGPASPSSEPHEEAQRLVDALLGAFPPASTEPARFWAAQFDHGLAWVDFPPGRGGAGLSPTLQPFVDEELRGAGAPANWSRNPIGIAVAGPAIAVHGGADQADRFLRRLFTCEEIWCQLFSEPGAGSDLAGLTTLAVPSGDGWRIDGHKCWITLAHAARWGLLLARTDPEQPKHDGLTCFLVDMTAPGVSVRPQRQMTGQAEFDEVVLAGVNVSDEQRLGPVGGGWDVARSILMRERAAIGDLVATRGRQVMERAVALWREQEHRDPVLRDRLVSLWVEAEVAQLTSRRAQGPERPHQSGDRGPERPHQSGDRGPERPHQSGDRGPERPHQSGDRGPERPHQSGDRGPERPRQSGDSGGSGPEAAIAKLVFAEWQQRISEFCLALGGPAGLLYESYEMSSPTEMGTAGDDLAKAFLRSRATTIEAGTSEVLRTVLAERVLGLPREPRADTPE